MTLKLNDKSLVIACHEIFGIGPAHDLRDFLLKKKAREILFISHPLLFNKDTYKDSSRYKYYKNGKFLKSHQAIHWILPEAVLYIKDVIYNFIWVLSLKEKINIYVGVDPLNALAGIILRILKKVEKVIYYSIDLFPNRFENSLMNKIYFAIDKYSVKFSDVTWNVSKQMIIAREKYHNDKSLALKQIEVPIGVWFNQIKRKRFKSINKKKLTFIGLISEPTGVELIIKTLPRIIKKIPHIQLDIIGSGPQEKTLKKLSSKLNLSSNIKFYGWVKDKSLKFKILSDAAVGLVLFNPKLYKEEIQNADPMKIKDYMVSGMPIISTNVISTGKAIKKAKCGIIIHYNEKELYEAVIKLLTGKKMLKEYRENAVNYIKQFDFEIVYGLPLKKIFTD